jgi:sulfopyruvate decarboxylase subunit alpha
MRVLREDYTEIATTLATREEEAFGIAAGLFTGGVRPTVMLQSSGLGNSINALTSLLIPFQIPVLIVISMRGDAGEWNDAQVPMGRAVRPILESIGIPHVTVERDIEATETVRAAGEMAFSTSTRLPAAVLLPRRITAPPVADGKATR